LCTRIFKDIAEMKRWHPVQVRSTAYFRFLADVTSEFFIPPNIPPVAWDKLSLESEKPPSIWTPYSVRYLNALEVMRKFNRAAHFGLQCLTFLTLLTEYVTRVCEENSPVSPDMVMLALQALDECVFTVFEQFSRMLVFASSTTGLLPSGP
jgi:hypothetical protein